MILDCSSGGVAVHHSVGQFKVGEDVHAERIHGIFKSVVKADNVDVVHGQNAFDAAVGVRPQRTARGGMFGAINTSVHTAGKGNKGGRKTTFPSTLHRLA